METQFFGVTFTATNQSDRKRCDWCGRIVHVLDADGHVHDRHPNVDPDHVRVEPGMTV